MKLGRIILFALMALIAALLVATAYYGGFKRVSFTQKPAGDYWLVFLKMKGDYAQSPIKMDSVYYWLEAQNIKSEYGFGRYYDNPELVEPEYLRSDIGCIISKPDSATKAVILNQFNLEYYPKVEHVVCEFPFKGALSVLFGVYRVYPRLNDYIRSNNLYKKDEPMMEVYDVKNAKIHYLYKTGVGVE